MRAALDLSRRRFIRGGLAACSVAALGSLAGCTSDETGPSDTPAGAPTAPDGPWTWDDEIGQSIELDRTPTRIAAYGDAAAALMNFGITPVAIFHYSDPQQDSAFEDLDLDDIEIIGTTYGEINVEQLAALAPDLVVTTFYSDDTPDAMYGFKDQSQIETIRQLAPITGVMQAGSALDVITTNEKLVASLGIDVERGRVAEDRAAFEAASAALTEAAASGLTVVPVYAEDANLYYAKAADDPALTLYADLGVSFTPVTGEDYYWEIVSWEQADTYSPDILLYSVRDSYTPEQLMGQPTFAALPAAQADQLHPWKFRSMDYPAQTSYMTELADWLSSDRKVV